MAAQSIGVLTLVLHAEKSFLLQPRIEHKSSDAPLIEAAEHVLPASLDPLNRSRGWQKGPRATGTIDENWVRQPDL